MWWHLWSSTVLLLWPHLSATWEVVSKMLLTVLWTRSMDSMDFIVHAIVGSVWQILRIFKHIRLPQVTTPQTVYREVPPKMPNGDGKVWCRFERFLEHRQVRPRPSAPAVATRLSSASPKSAHCQCCCWGCFASGTTSCSQAWHSSYFSICTCHLINPCDCTRQSFKHPAGLVATQRHYRHRAPTPSKQTSLWECAFLYRCFHCVIWIFK